MPRMMNVYRQFVQRMVACKKSIHINYNIYTYYHEMYLYMYSLH